MAQHVFSVLCRRPIIDQGSNLLSMIDVLDGIAVESTPTESSPKGTKPALALDAFFVSQFSRSTLGKGEKFEARVVITGPDGKKLGGTTGTRIDLTHFQNHRMTTKLDRLPFAGAGRYEFKVQLQEGKRWRTVAAVPFAIKLQEPPVPADK